MTGEGLALDVRAYAPKIEMRIAVRRSMVVEFSLSNVSVNASMTVTPAVSVDSNSRTGLTRSTRLRLLPGRHRIEFQVPFDDQFRFGFIGDSGGGSELAWCLTRAAALGADFVLHAGDFYYSDQDFATLSAVLEDSPLPVYASIGNHDFHRDGRYIHRDFTREVGPRNAYFQLGETLFVNFDTAASTWPVGSGERAELFERLRSYRQNFDQVVLMTHRPLHDPRFQSGSDEAHALSEREKHWVVDELLRLTPEPVLLAGHIHISAEHVEDGIKTYVSGEGLGSRNLVSGRAIARILVGEKRPGRAVTYRWEPLDMPVAAYCHEKNRETLHLMDKPAPPGSFGSRCVNYQ
ncbi:MAG: hypothetical protein DWQ08_09390 [Proteobacteria bacterium]|nr:MAG: hypothetical protein DWQ08_09390 [Pseudomonadota bacterium]